MGNNFIFQQDPLLLGKNMSAEETMQHLELYKKALAEQSAKSMPQQSNVFEDIEKEISSLTEDQKSYLMSQEEFVDCQSEVDQVTQAVLANMLRPYILNNPEAKAVIERQLETIKTIKKRAIKEANKQQDLFKEYTEHYSNMSWNEYIQLKNDINKQRAAA